MEKKIQYTVSIYTENNVGLLNRISAVFLKRHINIESFTTSECEIENVFRFIIVVEMTESGIEKVIKQIEKQVDVIKAFYHTDEETIFQETALYKVKSNSLFEERHIQNSIKESMYDISWVEEENKLEISKWYLKNKGFYFLDGEKRTEPYGIKKVVNITEKSKNLNKNKK